MIEVDLLPITNKTPIVKLSCGCVLSHNLCRTAEHLWNQLIVEYDIAGETGNRDMYELARAAYNRHYAELDIQLPSFREG